VSAKQFAGKVKFRFLLNLAFETISRGALVREKSVQKISTATASIIVLIAFYFMLSWGYEALRVLTSPSYGFEDVWRSQFLFGIGRLFDLGPTGLVKLAAFFATLKLAVACICALHIADRARSLTRGQPNSEILEAGLILVVLISIASVGPASWAQSIDLMREHTYQLLFAALAVGLCIFERSHRAKTKEAEPQRAVDAAATKAAPRLHV
jgi:hypothetical protein